MDWYFLSGFYGVRVRCLQDMNDILDSFMKVCSDDQREYMLECWDGAPIKFSAETFVNKKDITPTIEFIAESLGLEHIDYTENINEYWDDKAAVPGSLAAPVFYVIGQYTRKSYRFRLIELMQNITSAEGDLPLSALIESLPSEKESNITKIFPQAKYFFIPGWDG